MDIKISIEPIDNNIVISSKEVVVEYRESGKKPQEKEVTYTDNGSYEITPDDGYILEQVNVNVDVPIPEGYLKPEGAIDIISTEEVDVTPYSKAKIVDENLKAENIAENVNVLGIKGTFKGGIDTNDATATPNDLLKGKIAYANEEKIVGTIETFKGENSEGATFEIDEFLKGDLTEYTNDRITETKYGFCNNYSITTVNMANVEFIGDRTFSGAAKLINVNMPKIKKVGAYGFHGTKINADNPIFSTIEEWEGTNQFYSLATKGEINMPKITTVSNACFASASITRFRADNVTSVGNQAFATTSNLETVELPNCETLGNQVFQNSKIKYISLPKVKKLATQLFNGATALETAEFDSLESISGGMTFYNCSSLKALILRNNLVVTFGQANSFDGSGISKGTGFVYVPDDLVDSYKAATNWSKYAEQIKGLSEYVEV